MSPTLSSAEAARVLEVPEARVREWMRAGLGAPQRRGHRHAISFPDLVVLRAARGLLEAGVPAARVRRALAGLAREEPRRPLSGLRLVADGREVAVCDGGRTWQLETGQGVLDFGEEEVARQVETLRDRAGPGRPDGAALRARLEFERALDLEDDAPQSAAAAYRRALELDPELLDASVNLGRLLHQAGDPAGALDLYTEALSRSPDDPVLHFNLALALEDTQGAEAATTHYERALALDPDFADAHYNVAGLYERLGRGADALRHYRAYQQLTR